MLYVYINISEEYFAYMFRVDGIVSISCIPSRVAVVLTA
jgi:hypothetical protein